MKIVVLDGYAANPADLSWNGMKELGDLTVYDRTSPQELMDRVKGAEALLTNKVVLNEEMIDSLPSLKYIGVLATGYNVVDIAAAKKKNIVVSNIPAYSTMSVAQMVFAHILNITQRVGYYTEQNRQKRWSHNEDFCYWDYPLIELAGKQMGIVGLGHTGIATAKIAIAMGIKVVAFTSKSQSSLSEDIHKTTLDELFRTSDIVSLHCPLTSDTKEMVNAYRLEQMKNSAILINTGRGQLVNEFDLAEALNSGKIYAAGMDVMVNEPPKEDNPLLSAKNCFITPHIAWATREARVRLMNISIENLKKFIEGHPQNNVAL